MKDEDLVEKLEKDVEYYKLLARDLKSKLRQQSLPQLGTVCVDVPAI